MKNKIKTLQIPIDMDLMPKRKWVKITAFFQRLDDGSYQWGYVSAVSADFPEDIR